jgi:hypothetical protein
MQPFGDVAVAAFLEAQLDAGMGTHEIDHGRRCQRLDKAAQRGKGDPAAIDAAHRVLALQQRRQNAPRIGEEGRAALGQLHFSTAREQRAADMGFQRADAHRDRRLGDIEPGGGLGEAAVAHDPVKAAELVDIHKDYLCDRSIFPIPSV